MKRIHRNEIKERPESSSSFPMPSISEELEQDKCGRAGIKKKSRITGEIGEIKHIDAEMTK